MSSTLFKSTVGFRRGTNTITPIEESDRPSLPPPATKASVLQNPVRHVQQREEEEEKEDTAVLEQFRSYPSSSYYGLLSSLEIQITSSPVDAASLATIHSLLQKTVNEKGALYYFGSQPLECGYQLGDQRTTPSCFYSAYLASLQSCITHMQHARKSRDDLLPSHTTYLRIANHPKWKNMSFMLAVEKGRLVFYGSASSRVTQEEWLRRASELAVPLTWIAGGVFVMEERAMGVTDVNSVYVACEVLLNFPLLPPPEDGEDALMEGFSVALYSTFPFNGAQTHVPRLRCVLTGEGRSTWSLKGPTPLHGRLLQAVVACLVERTDVGQFHLYSDADEPEGGETKDRPGVAAEAGAVTFLRGRAGTHTVPHGKGCSSQMWYGFSRLSCQEWLDTETRDALGLWEEDGEEELECEFVPAHIFFTRAADRKRPRDTDDDHSSSSVAARWGKCFMIECKVMRIIDPEQVEETQGA